MCSSASAGCRWFGSRSSCGDSLAGRHAGDRVAGANTSGCFVIWFTLGWPAFIGVIAIFAVMIAKPQLARIASSTGAGHLPIAFVHLHLATAFRRFHGRKACDEFSLRRRSVRRPFRERASAQDLKIALIHGKTGPLEAYAKQTETGLRMGFEYATKGTMTVDGRKIVIIIKDDQTKPDVAKSRWPKLTRTTRSTLAIGTTASRGRARHAAGGGRAQEDPDRRAGGRRPDHRREVEPLHLPHRRATPRRTRSRTRSRSASRA